MNKKRTEYIIVGDTERYKECLIFACGVSLENAKRVLERVLNNPTDNDKLACKGHTNLRIKEVESDGCWWNYGCD